MTVQLQKSWKYFQKRLILPKKSLSKELLDFYFDHTDSITAEKISNDVHSGKEQIHDADDVFKDLGLE